MNTSTILYNIEGCISYRDYDGVISWIDNSKENLSEKDYLNICESALKAIYFVKKEKNSDIGYQIIHRVSLLDNHFAEKCRRIFDLEFDRIMQEAEDENDKLLREQELIRTKEAEEKKLRDDGLEEEQYTIFDENLRKILEEERIEYEIKRSLELERFKIKKAKLDFDISIAFMDFFKIKYPKRDADNGIITYIKKIFVHLDLLCSYEDMIISIVEYNLTKNFKNSRKELREFQAKFYSESKEDVIDFITEYFQKRRRARCYSCKTDLNMLLNDNCLKCGWLTCDCGACGCGYSGRF